MATSYSNVVSFLVTRGLWSCTGLPMPPRGRLTRLILTQTDGTATAATINVYDRKGACYAGNDLNVTASGVISNITDLNSYSLVQTEQPHGLLPGDTFVIKNAENTAYNTTFTVVSVPDVDLLFTTLSFAGGENTGALWQTPPFNPTTAPITHLILTAEKASDADYTDLELSRSYENKDNQSETMRTRTSSLWLELITEGEETDLQFQVAYTCQADDPI